MTRLVFALLTTAMFSAQQPFLPQLDVDREFDRLLQEYSEAGAARDAGRLVLIDLQLRNLAPSHNWMSRPSASSQGYRSEYERLGLTQAHYAPEALQYSGKLLREAHAIDAKAFRSYTLFSTLFDDDGEYVYLPPDPEATKAYLQEFPRGPFAVHANLALANFYDDLFKVMNEMTAGRSSDHDCYLRYVDKTPREQQRRNAQRAAIKYYERLTQLLPDSLIMRRSLAEMRKGESEGWHFCGD